jgi:glycosyltransferase involved in cell wall biosynthesis
MKTNAPLFSVLLPTHNRADVLTYAIQSVLAQTIQDFELLIVGDGCTDNSAEVVNSFNDSRIQWFDLPKAPNFGYANRNIALKPARGSLIAFMAHDDLWFSDHLEILMKAFIDETIEIAYSRPLWAIPQGMIVPGTFNLHIPEKLERYINKEEARIPASCFVHRKECFSKYGYLDETLSRSADWDLWARFIQGGDKKNFAYIEQPTCLHFKANWQTEKYDYDFGFRFWRGLFAEGFIPKSLKTQIAESITEQEAIWANMKADSVSWNKTTRSAIFVVLDSLINKGFIDWDNLYNQLLTNQKENKMLTEGLEAFKSESEWAKNEIELIKKENTMLREGLQAFKNESERLKKELSKK